MSAEQRLGGAFQVVVDRYLKTEEPKVYLFYKKLEELRMPLLVNQISPDDNFFRRLIDETEPVKTLTLILEETMELERTPEGQIRITP